MSVIKGKNVILFFQYNGEFKPIACARSCSLTTNAEIGETSSKNTGIWKTYRGRRLDWTISADGLCSEDMNLTIPQLRQLQYTLNAVFINFTATDDNGIVENFSGYCIITSVTTSATYNAMYEYTMEGQGVGELVIKDTVDDPNECCDTLYYYYDGVGGEYNTGTISVLIGNNIDGDIFRDGVAYRPSGVAFDGLATPVGKQYRFDKATGTIYFDTNLPPIATGEPIDIPYLTCVDDGGTPCVDVTITDITLPDAVVNQAYSQNIALNGTAPFVIQPGYTIPSWMAINIIGSSVELSGTPTSGATGETISFTVTNCSGASDSFVDSIDTLLQTFYDSTTNVSSDAGQVTEISHITGPASATVTIKLINLINTNSDGHVLVNNIEKFLNDTFTVTLDGSGAGSFTAKITGNSSDTGTVVLAKFQIITVTSGVIGSPDIYQISKVF